jgi:predicted nucleic acid-binding protein
VSSSTPRDLMDEPYINLAVQAQASFLISRDNDLLDLPDAASPDCRRLQVIARSRTCGRACRSSVPLDKQTGWNSESQPGR